jgi:coenzyme F420-reducing hydrogenase gamma subunit
MAAVSLVAGLPVGPAPVARPRVGVVKLTSCDGCQLTILDLEDELLAISERFDIIDFPEATSSRSAGPYDVLFVEGSISDPDQVERIHDLRARTRLLVSIGACATAGGIQAMRNWGKVEDWASSVYPDPSLIRVLDSVTPVSDHVKVDAELRGCPISPEQLREFLAAALAGRRPQLPDEAVCLECKRRGYPCVVVSGGLACLGPVTRAGCGALCPAFGRGCYGCFGPREQPNVPSLASQFETNGLTVAEAGRRFAGFTGWAEPFRAAIPDDGPARPPRSGLEEHDARR